MGRARLRARLIGGVSAVSLLTAALAAVAGLPTDARAATAPRPAAPHSASGATAKVAHGTDGNVTGADIGQGAFRTSAAAQARMDLITGKPDAQLRIAATTPTTPTPKTPTAKTPTANQPRTFTLTTMATVPQPVDKHILSVPYAAQQKNYWCGPATAYMILAAKNATVSHYTGYQWGLNQTALAGSPYLKTEQNGATRFGKDVMAPALNLWLTNNAAGHYQQVAADAMPSYSSLLTYDIDRGYPTAVGTVEMSGGPHYNHHPVNETIGHWIVGYGYADKGRTAYFADPATSLWASRYGVEQRFSYGSDDFWRTFLKANGNGIVW